MEKLKKIGQFGTFYFYKREFFLWNYVSKKIVR